MEMRRIITTTAMSLTVLVWMNANLQAQIFLHYGFDNDYLDSSGNANHGVLEDTPGTPAFFQTGTQGTHYQFGTHAWDSPDASDKVAFTNAFTPADGDPWTISLWYDMPGGTGSPLFSDATSLNRFHVRNDPFNGAFGTINGQSVEWEDNLAMNSNWNHYAIVANGSGVDLDGVPGDDALVLYFNGNAVASDAGFDLTNIMTDITADNVGDGVPSDSTASEGFRGAFGLHDELWIFNAALTADEVNDLFLTNTPPDFSTAPVVPEPSSLVLWSLVAALLTGAGCWRRYRARA